MNAISKTHASTTNPVPHHSMVTRLKSGVIERQNYATYLATFPESKNLHLTEDEPFSSGYSFVTEISDTTEPSRF